MNLIIGTGLIAEEYIKILQSMNISFEVIGNTEQKCKYISEKYNIICHSNCVENFKFLKEYVNIIIATPLELLYSHLKLVLINSSNVKNIFIEKPGCIYTKELDIIIKLKNNINHDCNIYIAYNRRFYSSLEMCNEIILEDPIINSELEINERNLNILVQQKSGEVMQNWFNCMTSHIIDMFFHIIGKPTNMLSFHDKVGTLDWHNRSTCFYGNGRSNKNINFNYKGDWSQDGKWKIKLFLQSGKILEFQPLEYLKIINKSNITIKKSKEIDIRFKPGFYKQIESFFGNKNNLKTIEEQYNDYINIYDKISNYNKEYTIIIIGLGQIGFRHMESIVNTNLNIKLFLIDINDININKCKEYLTEHKFNNFMIYNNVKCIVESDIDLIIVSTCSNIRYQIIKDISESKIKLIKNLILEKIIFINSSNFDNMEVLLKNKININNIYCSSYEYYKYKINILSNEFDLTNSNVKISGSNWGLCCNSVHFIMCFLNIFEDINFKPDNIKIIDSKRLGFKEVLGRIVDKNIILEDNNSGDNTITITMKTTNNFIKIENNNNNINEKIYDNNNKLIRQTNYKIDFLSTRYIQEYKNILNNQKCSFVNYKIAKKAHLILIDIFSQIFMDSEQLPIT